MQAEKNEIEQRKTQLSDECSAIDGRIAGVRQAIRLLLRAAADEGQQFAQVLQTLVHQQGEVCLTLVSVTSVRTMLFMPFPVLMMCINCADVL
jgi:hypothetical protein